LMLRGSQRTWLRRLRSLRCVNPNPTFRLWRRQSFLSRRIRCKCICHQPRLRSFRKKRNPSRRRISGSGKTYSPYIRVTGQLHFRGALCRNRASTFRVPRKIDRDYVTGRSSNSAFTLAKRSVTQTLVSPKNRNRSKWDIGDQRK